MAKFHWHGALCSTHKSCIHGHVSWKRGGEKRELVSAPWTSARQFSHLLWSKAHNHWLLRACLLGSKRKLQPPAVVCRLWLPGTVYTCNQGPLSSGWAHCISCALSAYSLCRRCCCCPLQCDRQHMGTSLNSAGGRGSYHRSWSLSLLHLLLALSVHCFFPGQEPSDTFLQRFSYYNKVISIEVLPGDPRAELMWQG